MGDFLVGRTSWNKVSGIQPTNWNSNEETNFQTRFAPTEQSGAENTKTLIATFIFPFNGPLYFDKVLTSLHLRADIPPPSPPPTTHPTKMTVDALLILHTVYGPEPLGAVMHF